MPSMFAEEPLSHYAWHLSKRSWVIAYKIEKNEAVTQLLEIKTQIGKTGTVTPVVTVA